MLLLRFVPPLEVHHLGAYMWSPYQIMLHKLGLEHFTTLNAILFYFLRVFSVRYHESCLPLALCILSLVTLERCEVLHVSRELTTLFVWKSLWMNSGIIFAQILLSASLFWYLCLNWGYLGQTCWHTDCSDLTRGIVFSKQPHDLCVCVWSAASYYLQTGAGDWKTLQQAFINRGTLKNTPNLLV